jgi:hypothetical protein
MRLPTGTSLGDTADRAEPTGGLSDWYATDRSCFGAGD